VRKRDREREYETTKKEGGKKQRVQLRDRAAEYLIIPIKKNAACEQVMPRHETRLAQLQSGSFLAVRFF
jgi:hypothetical protein